MPPPSRKPGPPRVQDPHPSNEEKYDRSRHPGGARPPKGGEAGVAVYQHDGEAPPPPRNETNT
jgi:hypothetical protein